MNGRPVWLASISRVRPNGAMIYVPDWSAAQLRDAERRLRALVAGVGDPTHERLFRMNITLCLHRAATEQEVATAPPWFLSAPGVGLAGGPVAVLAETVAGSASTKPCVAPQRQPLPHVPPHRHGWFPVDCGECAPCRARAAIT